MNEEKDYIDDENIIEEEKVDIDVDEIKENIKLKDVEKDKIAKLAKEEDEIFDKQEEIDEETISLYKEFNAFVKAKAEMQPDSGLKPTISTGIDLLDAVLGGGFALGTLNIIVGQPGSGKTMIAVQSLGNAQKIIGSKLMPAFLDAEEAMTTARLANLGVNRPKIKPYGDITVEKVFKFIESLCLFKEEKKIIDQPSIVVWDSIANTLSQKEREVDDINQVIGYKARLLSILIPKYVAKCAEYNICLIAINQLRDKLQMGMFSQPKELRFMSTGKEMPGGNTLRFNAFQLLEIKVKEAIDTRKPNCKFPFNGIKVSVNCVKNKIFPPNIEIGMVGTFVRGFSNFWTNFDFLSETKRMNTGAWNYLVNYPEKKFRTKDAFSTYKEDKTFREAFDKASEEAIKNEILSKNTEEL